jgi:hypothetical protein
MCNEMTETAHEMTEMANDVIARIAAINHHGNSLFCFQRPLATMAGLLFDLIHPC